MKRTLKKELISNFRDYFFLGQFLIPRHEEGYHRTLREYEQENRKRETLAAQQSADTSSYGVSAQPVSPHTSVRTKEPDLDRYLIVDRYRRNSLVDHFLPPATDLLDFAQLDFEEMGNFVELPYETSIQQDSNGIRVALSRDGHVRRLGALGPLQVFLRKTLFVPVGEEKLVVAFSIENRGQTLLQTRFACEWNFNFLGGGGNDQAYYHVEGQQLANEHFDSTGEITQVSNFNIGNSWIQQDMAFTLSEAAPLWRFSIETVTGSEAGFERIHQGSCLTLLWPLILEVGQSWSVEIHCNGHSMAAASEESS